jgi:hypothetical protein
MRPDLELGKQPCQRCCLSQAVTQTLSGGTGVIRDGLTALRQALLATERPTPWRIARLLRTLSRDISTNES